MFYSGCTVDILIITKWLLETFLSSTRSLAYIDYVVDDGHLTVVRGCLIALVADLHFSLVIIEHLFIRLLS